MDGVLLSLATDLLKQLGSITVQQAQQEINLIVGVDEEIENLQYNFKMVQAMLNKFEERRLRDDAVKLWYDKLEDAYYMMDDVLDTWKTAKIKLQIQKEEEGEKAAHSNAPAPLEKKMKKVWSFFPSPSCCCRQVDNVSVRHEVGHKIKKLNETLANIHKDKQDFGIDLNSQPETVERLEITSIVDVSEIVGRNEYRDDLLNNLLGMGSQEKSNPLVITLVGIGGIGKSTLANLAYNHSKVRDHFQKMMWVSVSDPFDQYKVAKAIIRGLDPEHESLKYTTPTLEDLLNPVRDLIKDKKFFLVFDDVWAKDKFKESEKWDPFKVALTHGAQGSRILVTTRNEEVAHMMGSAKTHIISLSNLTVDDCWLIIRKIAFFDENIDQHKDLEPLGRKLANKCHGLPLAAKLIGGYMCNKRRKEQWEKVLENSLWDLEDVEKGLLGPLLLSYYELSLAEKKCFLFCAVFPKDHEINRFELIIHWMAQGYIDIDSKRNMEMEDMAEEYFQKLAMRSFFQDFEKDEIDGRIESCKMHDIVHDFAQTMTKDVCFTIEVDKEVKINFKRARLLSLINEETFLKSVYEAKNLRFLNLDFMSSLVVQSKLFDNLTCLRTLHLEVEELPNEVKKLTHLRYLKLSSYETKELPESICNLCNLQSLDVIECTKLKKLPQGIGKLINLRHLLFDEDLEECKIKSFPKGIGRLTCLKTLTYFPVGGEGEEICKPGELEHLNHLRDLKLLFRKSKEMEEDTEEEEEEEEDIEAVYGQGQETCEPEEFEHLNYPCDLKLLFRKSKEMEEDTEEEEEEEEDTEAVYGQGQETCEPEEFEHLNYPRDLKLLFRKSKEMEEDTEPVGGEGEEIFKLGEFEHLNHLRDLKLLFRKSKEMEEDTEEEEDTEKEEEEEEDTEKEEEEEETEEERRTMEKDVAILNALEPPPRLESLLIVFYKGTTMYPNCMMSKLTYLKNLTLKDCPNLEQLPPLGKLPLLEKLEIENAPKIRKVGDEFLGIDKLSKSSKNNNNKIFPNLKSLKFEDLEKWKEWTGMGGTIEEEEEKKDNSANAFVTNNTPKIKIMPRLHSLIIYECPKLKSLPDYLRNTPLKELNIRVWPSRKQRYRPNISHTSIITIDGEFVQRDGQLLINIDSEMHVDAEEAGESSYSFCEI